MIHSDNFPTPTHSMWPPYETGEIHGVRAPGPEWQLAAYNQNWAAWGPHNKYVRKLKEPSQ